MPSIHLFEDFGLCSFARRFLDRSARVLFSPNDNEIVEEIERSIDMAGGKVLSVPCCPHEHGNPLS